MSWRVPPRPSQRLSANELRMRAGYRPVPSLRPLKWRTRFQLRLAGVRIEEYGDHHIIFRGSWWIPMEWLAELGRRLETEYELKGRLVSASSAGKLLRLDLIA